jgi:tryptophan synthase alpha subunit
MLGREHLLSTVRRVRESGRIALCGYFLAGFPTPTEFYRLVRAAQRLDVLEFGIPSGAPVFDGPTIAKAHQVVVCERGLDAETSLALIGGLRDVFPPRFVMTYAEDGRNLRGFLHSCTCNNIQGVLAPDVDRTEARHVAFLARAMDLAFVRFVDPDMSQDEIDEAAVMSDVLYLRIAAGSTGGSAIFELATCARVRGLLRRVRDLNPKILVAGGIGIRRADQIASLATLGFDMAIVGTTLVEQLSMGPGQLSIKVDELRQATLTWSA